MIEQKIKDKAFELGFSLCGFASAASLGSEDITRLAEWLENGFSSEMEYMKRNRDKRLCAQNLLDGARSVICVALKFDKVEPKEGSQCLISSYACYRDYHDVIKAKLFELADFLSETAGVNIRFKACVDSVPISERSYARRAGLGFIGKNTMLINPRLGSRILLGELITDLVLEPQRAVDIDCGDCRKCIEACPTGALSGGGIDCRKCLSYLTIESREPIPEKYRKFASTNIFGCDRCVDACPYNENIPPGTIKPIIESGYKFSEIAQMTEDEFREKFARTPLSRAGLKKIKSHLPFNDTNHC
jgi:epoxyqueuosine reductase